MPSWVETKARADAFYWSHAQEIWRQLKDCIEQAVYDWTRIYSPVGTEEIQCSSCPEASENCIRVRTIPPPSQKDKFIEFRFRPEERVIKTGSRIFSFHVDDKPDPMRLALREYSSTEEKPDLSVEDVCRLVLEPFFSTFGPRRPLNLPPV